MKPSALKGILEVIGKGQLKYFDDWIKPMLKKEASTYCAEQLVYKTVYYGGTYELQKEISDFHKAISGVLVTVSFIPGPIGMVACFIDAVCYAICQEWMEAGCALLGMIPGIRQLGLFSKFIKAFQKCPIITRIFTSWTNVVNFFDKIAPKLKQLKISPQDVSEVCGTLVENVNPFKGGRTKLIDSKLVTYTSESCIEAGKEMMSYAGKNVISGARLLSITVKSTLRI